MTCLKTTSHAASWEFILKNNLLKRFLLEFKIGIIYCSAHKVQTSLFDDNQFSVLAAFKIEMESV